MTPKSPLLLSSYPIHSGLGKAFQHQRNQRFLELKPNLRQGNSQWSVLSIVLGIELEAQVEGDNPCLSNLQLEHRNIEFSNVSMVARPLEAPITITRLVPIDFKSLDGNMTLEARMRWDP